MAVRDSITFWKTRKEVRKHISMRIYNQVIMFVWFCIFQRSQDICCFNSPYYAGSSLSIRTLQLRDIWSLKCSKVNFAAHLWQCLHCSDSKPFTSSTRIQTSMNDISNQLRSVIYYDINVYNMWLHANSGTYTSWKCDKIIQPLLYPQLYPHHIMLLALST